MNKEMIAICNVLNSLPGIHTTFCCYGHGDPGEFYICFRCSNIKSLKKISKENCCHKYPRTPMTEKILTKIIKCLKNEK